MNCTRQDTGSTVQDNIKFTGCTNEGVHPGVEKVKYNKGIDKSISRRTAHVLFWKHELCQVSHCLSYATCTVC